jgi:hypothetical protein
MNALHAARAFVIQELKSEACFGQSSGMTVSYLDPKAEPSSPIEPYDAVFRWTPDAGPLSIGLLANGFPDSDTFLRSVETAISTRLPQGTTTVFLNKGNASAAATPNQIDTMAAEVHAVVTAYGH